MKRSLLMVAILLTGLLEAHEVARYPFQIESLSLFENGEDNEVQMPHIQATASDELYKQIISRSKTLEDKLNEKIFGQDHAVKETANAIVRFAAGINDPNMPVACLLYCGPSGVGKTELAKQLAVELYGKESHFFRINMSEFSEYHTISRLIGSPPGYVDSKLGGSLSNRLLQNPYSIVLLDEIEKAHPRVLKLFLQVFDAGYFSSSRGVSIDCRKAIFILTSNIGACEIADLYQMGLGTDEIHKMLQPNLIKILSPEMYNRLDCMIFMPLSEEVYEKLIVKILKELKVRVLKARGIDLCFDHSLINYLKTFSLDPKLGARPIRRIVDKELATTLAKALVEQAYQPEDVVLCSYQEGQILLQVIFSPAN